MIYKTGIVLLSALLFLPCASVARDGAVIEEELPAFTEEAEDILPEGEKPEKPQEAEYQKIFEDYKSKIRDKDFKNSAGLQGLNKITARNSPLSVMLNDSVEFGNLEIELLSCWRAPPEENPESKALLRITEQIPGEQRQLVFHGWVFASSPAISGLEHPVYDISLIECVDVEAEDEEGN